MLISAITDLVDTLLNIYQVRYMAILQIAHRFYPTVPSNYIIDFELFNKKLDDSNVL